MRIDEIKSRLYKWSKMITTAYLGLKVRFEYSMSRGVFLVSLYTDDVDDMERFSADVMAFEDEMEALYGYDAPLFCDNEELFSLSQEAETVVGLMEMQPQTGWHFQLDDPFVGNFSYNLAA
ncbi:hypothetical protein [uncultured Duncaniella sp.]|uniref:hypothetical protein n=2 Tax=uncultured Duncaniella sp. TaxID=2768039 RepID=UPI0025AFFA46|nr:hypothetical protein [uncultured Duncaniella sp.]